MFLFNSSMIISKTEVAILIKIHKICIISLGEEINIRHFYDITSKIYLWNTIKKMEKNGIINSYMDGKNKYIYLTFKGIKICELVYEINNLENNS